MAKQEEWFKKHSSRVFGTEENFIKSRKFAAQKILSRLGGPATIKGKDVLDIGCSIGLITEEYAKYCTNAVGIDIDKAAINFAKKNCKKANCIYYDGTRFPFDSEIFDVIICNFVIEHVEDQKLLMHEIYRVLRKCGICYLSTDNKWRIMEAHYKLPFLSYLPKPLAGTYLKITGRGKAYYEKLPTYRQLRKLCRKFHVNNKAGDIIKNPKKYHVKKLNFITRNFLAKLDKKTLEKFSFMMPSFNLILTKPAKEGHP